MTLPPKCFLHHVKESTPRSCNPQILPLHPCHSKPPPKGSGLAGLLLPIISRLSQEAEELLQTQGQPRLQNEGCLKGGGGEEEEKILPCLSYLVPTPVLPTPQRARLPKSGSKDAVKAIRILRAMTQPLGL